VLEAGNLAGASAGAVQLRRTESAGVEARALCEAWIAG
jgi:hypothetical protein